MSGEENEEGQRRQVLTPDDLRLLRDARRKLKGSYVELSLCIVQIDKLIKKFDTIPVV